MGNIVTKYPVLRINKVTNGVSTLGGLKIWFDSSVSKLNTQEIGEFLGEFSGDDKIVTIRKTGHYRVTGYDLSTHFDDDIILIRKFNPEEIYSLAYYDEDLGFCYLKRFKIEDTDKELYLLGDSLQSKLYDLTVDQNPILKVTFGGKNEGRPEETIDAVEFIGEKSYRAHGKRVSIYSVATMKFEHNPDVPENDDDGSDNPDDWEEPDFEVIDNVAQTVLKL